MRDAAVIVLVLFCCAGPARADAFRLDLAAAEDLALAHNRDLQAAQRAVEAADAGTLIAGARPNPTLSFNASKINPRRGWGSGPSGERTVESTARIDQTLERGGKRELRLAQAADLAAAAHLDLDDLQRQTRFNVRAGWFDLKQAESRTALTQELARSAAQTLELARRRYRAGDLSGADLGRVEADAARARADARAAERDQARARTALALLLGQEELAPRLATGGDWPTPALAGPDSTAVDQAIAARADTGAATARVEAARQGVALTRAQRSRDITIGVEYEHQPQDAARNTLGLGISIPLFLGNDYRGEIRRAHADLGAAEDQLERVRAQVRSEIALRTEELQKAAARLQDLTEAALPATRRTAAAAALAFARGAISAFEFIDAQRALRNAEFDALDARVDLAKARAGLDATLEIAAPRAAGASTP